MGEPCERLSAKGGRALAATAAGRRHKKPVIARGGGFPLPALFLKIAEIEQGRQVVRPDRESRLKLGPRRVFLAKIVSKDDRSIEPDFFRPRNAARERLAISLKRRRVLTFRLQQKSEIVPTIRESRPQRQQLAKSADRLSAPSRLHRPHRFVVEPLGRVRHRSNLMLRAG